MPHKNNIIHLNAIKVYTSAKEMKCKKKMKTCTKLATNVLVSVRIKAKYVGGEFTRVEKCTCVH